MATISSIRLSSAWIDGFGQIQGKASHNRLGINHIPTGNKIKIHVGEAYQVVYEGFHFINGIQGNTNRFHKTTLLSNDEIIVVRKYFKVK